MMQGNRNIFLTGDDTLRYLARQIHKRYSVIFIWGHQISTCEFYDLFFDPFYDSYEGFKF